MTLHKKTQQTIELMRWILGGRNGAPPHKIKQKVLRDFAKAYKLSYFVETGTHSGAMVNPMRGKFYQSAKKWFENDASVSMIHGDSGVELKTVVKQLPGPSLFWLDGHCSAGSTARGSKDTPIIEELDHIYAENKYKHLVIIDDARLFGVDPAYPTIQEIESQLDDMHLRYELSIAYDAIRIIPT